MTQLPRPVVIILVSYRTLDAQHFSQSEKVSLFRKVHCFGLSPPRKPLTPEDRGDKRTAASPGVGRKLARCCTATPPFPRKDILEDPKVPPHRRLCGTYTGTPPSLSIQPLIQPRRRLLFENMTRDNSTTHVAHCMTFEPCMPYSPILFTRTSRR